MELLDLIDQELRAYRKTGRPVHLAHAARALEEVQVMLGRTYRRPNYVDAHNKSRE